LRADFGNRFLCSFVATGSRSATFGTRSSEVPKLKRPLSAPIGLPVKVSSDAKS